MRWEQDSKLEKIEKIGEKESDLDQNSVIIAEFTHRNRHLVQTVKYKQVY